MTDHHLLRAFAECSLSPADFRHRDHVFVAWSYLRQDPFGEAGQRFCRDLRRFAEAHGKTKLFHATITWAYVALIHERMQDSRVCTRPLRGSGDSRDDFDTFAADNPDLFDHAGGAVTRIYDAQTLASERARRVFVLPRPRLAAETTAT